MEHSEWRASPRSRFPNGRWELTLAPALYRGRTGRLEFALPWSPARPWPLTELFCFARAEHIGAEVYIIYAFDEKKAPIF